MTEQGLLTSDVKIPYPETVHRIAAEATGAVGGVAAKTPRRVPTPDALPDMTHVLKAFGQVGQELVRDPATLAAEQVALYGDSLRLGAYAWQRFAGLDAEPVVEPQKGDRRFKDPAWVSNPFFDVLKQGYLLWANAIQSTMDRLMATTADPHTVSKAAFYVRQAVNAAAPTNHLATNPEAIRKAFESGGESLLRGARNLARDAERGKISQTQPGAFEVGENIAVTPGKVVYQNDLMQLIQYSPTTERVYRTPLLIVPPWINKFYILDLRAKNSFVKWAVDQGFTVFVVSWVNPDASYTNVGFEDYLNRGPLEALDIVEHITGEDQTNVIGYCLGGTLTSCMLSYLAQTGQGSRVRAATFFTTMVDFAEAGELGVFLDEDQVADLEREMSAQGYLDGSKMAAAFDLMRENDLIWSFVQNNYLLGEDPFPFDLLHWNSDNTRMPAAMHSFYLRRMYLENKLIEPGGIVLNGVPMDLNKIRQPAFVLATKEDHIAPWKSGYALTQAISGRVKFVLAQSGHIAGVVNPPAKGKYGYWVNSKKPKSPDAWLAKAEEKSGSWWPEWHRWMTQNGGNETVPARQPGGAIITPIEDAPGSYVRVK